MITDINSEDRLVQETFAERLEKVLGWESVYAYNAETFGPRGTLGRASEREVVLVRDLRAALLRLNPGLPQVACDQAVEKKMAPGSHFASLSEESSSTKPPSPLTGGGRNGGDGNG